MVNKTDYDFTSMSTFQTCRRKYDLRINKGYVGKVAQTAPDFGKAIHLALDSWYADKDVDKAVAVFNGAYTEDLEIDDKRTNALGEWIIRNYHTTYRDQAWELIESEIEFKLPLPNGNNFTGRVDKIIRWDGTLWIVDHKTMSSLGQTYHYMTEPSLQFVGYAWAMKQRGYDIKGFILDAILVAKGLMPSISTTTGAKVAANKNLTPLSRYDVYYKQEHFDEWLDTVTKIQRDIKIAEESDEWYPNFSSCINFIECPYRKVCKEETGIRQRILDADYEVKHWSPLTAEVKE